MLTINLAIPPVNVAIERCQYGGSYNKAGAVAVLTEWRSAFECFALDNISATAEEDRVVVEMTVKRMAG